MSFSYYQFSSWSNFLNVFVQIFFVLTFGLPGGFVHITMYQLKRIPTLSDCIIRLLSSGIVGPKCKGSEEHGFKAQAIVSP